MGNCCSCLTAKDGSDRFSEGSPAASPIHGQQGYGTIKTEASDPWVPTKDTDKLVKSGSARPKQVDKPLKREAAIPKERDKLVKSGSARPKQVDKPSKRSEAAIPKTNVQPARGNGQEIPKTEIKEAKVTSEKTQQIKQERGDVTFSPPYHSSNQSDDTPGDETISESETAVLVSNQKNKNRERDIKKGKRHITFVTSKVTKTAGKMKKALKKHEKEDHNQRKYQEKSSERGSSGNFDRGKIQRVSSSRMKSKYARERMEKMEKERDEREKLKQQTQGFRDPRKAAIERGEKLGELDDTTVAMRNKAAEFAETINQFTGARKK